MGAVAESGERIVYIERPVHHFNLLIADDGRFLGLDEAGKPAIFEDGDDRVIWDQHADGIVHVTTGKVVPVDIDKNLCAIAVDGAQLRLTVSHGPSKLPSEYLAELRREGLVALACIVSPEIVEGLERVGCTGRYEHLEQTMGYPKICQDIAVGKSVAEPVSLWLLRQYLGSRDLHLGHPPGFAVLEPNVLARAGRGWHSDIPYTRSKSGQVFERIGPIKACNRNVCVNDFTHLNGATMFKLRSHLVDSDPPEEWNAPLLEDPPGLPYAGPEATVAEVPSGSIILYDARTWHRAGFNRSEHKRGSMAQSFQTADVIPKTDTRHAYNKLAETTIYQELNDRERRVISDLLLNQPENT